MGAVIFVLYNNIINSRLRVDSVELKYKFTYTGGAPELARNLTEGYIEPRNPTEGYRVLDRLDAAGGFLNEKHKKS